MEQREFIQYVMSLVVFVALSVGGNSNRTIAEETTAAPPATAHTAGPLHVHPKNPRYFADRTGKIVYLTGLHFGWELQDNAWGRKHVFDYERFLNCLEQHHLNFFRLWSVEHTRTDKSNPEALATPMPFRRTGPGNALDGAPKFDLQQFNPAYFARLRTRCRTAADKGIYVAVMLFQGFSLHQYHEHNPWFGHPMNRLNNINEADGDLNRDGDGREIHTLANPKMTAIQEAYVRHVIDTVNDLDNVLYEIGNECGGYATAWQYHMIRFIQQYESDKPKQHPVGMTVQIRGRDHNNSVLFDSPADWISPNKLGGYGTDPPPADGRKVIISDTDHHGATPYPERRVWVWKSFLRGHNPIFLDMYPDQERTQRDRIINAQFAPRWEPIRQAMGWTRRLAEQIDLAQMTPRTQLASTGYCLADPGREYLVYQPDTGSFDLQLEPGTYNGTWYDPRTGSPSAHDQFEASSGPRRFAPPFAHDALLHLTRVQPAAAKSSNSENLGAQH